MSLLPIVNHEYEDYSKKKNAIWVVVVRCFVALMLHGFLLVPNNL